MILTEEISVDLGNQEIKIKIIKNSEQLLTESIDQEETPVWVELWPSSLALARWIWNGPSLTGRTVLELGAGLGLPGVVAAKKGAEVLQTDYAEDALEVIKETAELNKLSNIRTALADWRSFDIQETFDHIIGSDILYHPGLNPFLKKIFQNNLNPGGKIVMADAGRKDSLAFVRELLLDGWQVLEEHIRVTQGPFDYRISVYQISPPAAELRLAAGD